MFSFAGLWDGSLYRSNLSGNKPVKKTKVGLTKTRNIAIRQVSYTLYTAVKQCLIPFIQQTIQ